MIIVPGPVLEAFANYYGTPASGFVHFGGGREDSDGVVYAYPFESRRRLLKILAIPREQRQRGLFCLEERLRFVRYMGENGARIVYPQFSTAGRLYEIFEYEDHVWIGYGMEIAPGSAPQNIGWNAEFFRNWGQTIGRLHRLASHYPSWEASYDRESQQSHLTWLEEWESFYHWCPDEEVKHKWLLLQRQLQSLPVERDSFGFIHNDPHIWNLLVEGEQITLLDFDVANHHWFINDIAIACQSILFDHTGGMERPLQEPAKLREFVCLLKEGYERENRLDDAWWEILDLFIAYRRIVLFIVMNEWILSQPDLHNSWKAMILTQPQVVGSLEGLR